MSKGNTIVLLLLWSLSVSTFFDGYANSDFFCRPCLARTIFVPRQPVTDQVLELALTNYFMYHNDIEYTSGIYFNATPFFEQTTHACDFGRYFLPHHKGSIRVSEHENGDINSTFLGLISKPERNFDANIRIRPKRRVFGALLNAQLDLGWFRHGSWLTVSIAPLRVEHDLHIKERKSCHRGTVRGFSSTLDVLTGRHLRFGKVSKRQLTETGIDDVLIKFGFSVLEQECGHIDLYTIFTFPTGKRYNDRFLFEPTVGTIHFSSGAGINAEYIFWQRDSREITWMTDMWFRHVHSKNQRRSFDFCRNGEWSRFLPVATDRHRNEAEPAINFFSPCVRVEPRGNIDFWTALHYRHCDWHLEVGYDLWWRQSERVYLRNNCNMRKDLGIFDIVKTHGKPTSASRATLTSKLSGDGKLESDKLFTNVTDCDLNLCSGTTLRALTHKVYLGSSYNIVYHDIPMMAGLAASYEFVKHHGSRGIPETWAIWGKLGIGF